MKKALSLLLCGIILLVCSFGLSACIPFDRATSFPYRGEYKELYTTAIYSIPDAQGYIYHGEGAFDSDIYVWEQDDYGRTLFAYCEDRHRQIFGLVIAQPYDETNVYFYPDINYELTLIDSDYINKEAEDNYVKNRTEAFYLKIKDELKEKNDWNKSVDKSKCVSYPITDHKILGQNLYLLDKDQCNVILNEYSKTLNFVNPDTTPYEDNSILQVDAEGKLLHEISGDHVYYDKLEWNKWDPYAKDLTYYDIILWVITDKDGNYDKENGIMVMYSKANDPDRCFIYNTDDVLEFKNKNNWINSYCGD